MQYSEVSVLPPLAFPDLSLTLGNTASCTPPQDPFPLLRDLTRSPCYQMEQDGARVCHATQNGINLKLTNAYF